MATFKETIEEYLQTRCKEEPQFALKMQNPKKNIDECVKFIYGEVFHKYVKEHRDVQVAVPTREEVFGLAVHYYDEEDIKIRPLTGVARAAASGSAGNTPNSNAKTKDKETVKKNAKAAETTRKREEASDDDLFAGSLFDASMFE